MNIRKTLSSLGHLWHCLKALTELSHDHAKFLILTSGLRSFQDSSSIDTELFFYDGEYNCYFWYKSTPIYERIMSASSKIPKAECVNLVETLQWFSGLSLKQARTVFRCSSLLEWKQCYFFQILTHLRFNFLEGSSLRNSLNVSTDIQLTPKTSSLGLS